MRESITRNEQRVELCPICFSSIADRQTIFAYLKQDFIICGNCKKNFIVVNKNTLFYGVKLHILYVYNTFMESLLFQYKEGNDIALQEIFFHDVVKELETKFRDYTIVFPPSSLEKNRERGFHCLESMLQNCCLHKISPFKKIGEYKQSSQPFNKRGNVEKHIRFIGINEKCKKRLLIVDDVCTSGHTLRVMIQLLKSHYEYVEALVLTIHPKLLIEMKHHGLNKGIFSLEDNKRKWFMHNNEVQDI